jgi:heat shock protein HslJ
MRTAVASLVAGLAAVIPVGCGGDEGATVAEPMSLEGVQWALVSGIDLETEDAASAPSATFDSGGVAGRAICNSYASTYTVDGSSLDVQPVALTRMACPPPGDALEDAFFDALEGVRSWAIEDDELVLMDGDGDELLRFEPAPES